MHQKMSLHLFSGTMCSIASIRAAACLAALTSSGTFRHASVHCSDILVCCLAMDMSNLVHSSIYDTCPEGST